MVNLLERGRWFPEIPGNERDSCVRVPLESQNHLAPNQQLTIGWENSQHVEHNNGGFGRWFSFVNGWCWGSSWLNVATKKSVANDPHLRSSCMKTPGCRENTTWSGGFPCPPWHFQNMHMLGKFTNGNGKSKKTFKICLRKCIYRFVIAIKLSHVGIFTKTK